MVEACPVVPGSPRFYLFRVKVQQAITYGATASVIIAKATQVRSALCQIWLGLCLTETDGHLQSEGPAVVTIPSEAPPLTLTMLIQLSFEMSTVQRAAPLYED